MRFAGPCLALLPFLAVACGGGLDADTSSPSTLATVSGTITNPQSLTIAKDALRVAVVWDTSGQQLADGGYDKDHRTTQDIKVTSVFPVNFTLNFSEVPTDLQPFTELFGSTGNPDLRGAGGYIVAYEDTNGDAKLDLAGPTDKAFVDRVLGSAGPVLLYLEGKMPADLALLANAADTVGRLPTLGFNLLVNYCTSGKTPPAGKTCDTAFDWQTVDAPISLALTGDPELAELMCQQIPGGIENSNGSVHPAGELPATLPASGDPAVTCDADGRGFTTRTCVDATAPGICQDHTKNCQDDQYSLAKGTSAPAGWPCTVR